MVILKAVKVVNYFMGDTEGSSSFYIENYINACIKCNSISSRINFVKVET